MTTVGDLAVDVEAAIMETQSLGAAAQRLEGEGLSVLVVLDLRHRPIGIVTAEELEAAQAEDPHSWTRRLCLSVLKGSPAELDPSRTVADVLARYRESGVRPVLVHGADAGASLRVVFPAAVLTWCATHQPGTVEELSRLAVHPPQEQP